MTKFLYATAALAALTLTSTTALAAPATQNATATARIVKPLTLTSDRNFDLGTITLTGSGSTTVSLASDGTFNCPAGNATCVGPYSTARYIVTGVNNRNVSVSVEDVVLTNQTDGTLLTLAVDAPATVNLGNSGNAGTPFYIGGAVTVDGDTTEGSYEGDFEVFVNY